MALIVKQYTFSAGVTKVFITAVGGGGEGGSCSGGAGSGGYILIQW